MIYENVEFHVRHENLGNVDTSFAATRPLLLASAKCQTAELFQSVNEPGSYLLRLGWEKAEDRPGTFPGRVPATVFTQMVTTYDMSPLRQSVPGPDQQAAESSGNDTIRIMPSANGEETWGAPALSRVREVLISLGEGHLNPTEAENFRYFCRQLARYDSTRSNPIVSVVDHVGNYWRNWLLMITRTGPYRPSTLRKLLAALDPSHPISQRMLTLNLRMLERDGLIARDVIDDERRHVEYSLTVLGRGLSDRLLSLIDWIDQHAAEIEASNAAFGELPVEA
jgi:DNA-binding HxlR family transcriptional regulator